jgi:hypothetical protein
MQTGTPALARNFGKVSVTCTQKPKRALTPYTALSTNQGKRVDCAHQEDADNNRLVLVQASPGVIYLFPWEENIFDLSSPMSCCKT